MSIVEIEGLSAADLQTLSQLPTLKSILGIVKLVAGNFPSGFRAEAITVGQLIEIFKSVIQTPVNNLADVAYPTLAEALTHIDDLPSGKLVLITNDGANNGLYLSDGTTLNKTEYDAIVLSDVFSDIQTIMDVVKLDETTDVTSQYGDVFYTLKKAIYQVIQTGGFEPFLTQSALLASVPTVPKKAAKALDTHKIWYWGGSSWIDTGLSELDQAKIQDEVLETNRPQNPNKFTLDQVLFNTFPTATTGTRTVVYRNGIKQMKLVSAATGGSIVVYWDFPVSQFTREFSASVCVEGLTSGSNGLVGIQQVNDTNTVLSSTYAATAVTASVTKQTYKVNVSGVTAGATKIRLIVNMLTTGTREMYVHSPFIADGTNTDFIAPEKAVDLQPIENQLNQVSADVTKIGQAFEYVGQKNIFNPALSTDGKIISYETGTLPTFANGIAFSKVAVQAGKTYTFWIPVNSSFYFRELIYTFGADGLYLGLDKSSGSAYQKLNPAPPTDVTYSDGKRTVTFTIPANSEIAYVQMMAEYSTHTTAQFNALVNSMQFELGSVKTAFEAYDPNAIPKIVLKESSLPAINIPTVSEIKNTFNVTLDGTDAYIRTKFSETLDLVQQVRYGTNAVWSNNVINPWSVRTIPKSTAKDGVIAAFSSGTILASQGDDAAPLHYNGTYIGANHGAYIVHEVTVNAHGKTYVDVGSRWTQGANTYTLVRIVDANKLWLVSQNIGATYWQFVTSSLSGLALTHSIGATNTASFTPSTDTLTQLLSALNNHSKKIIIDGFQEITANGVYDAEFVDFVDNYDIMNPSAILAYLHANTGTATERNLSVDSIASDMRVGVTYRYGLNGSMSVNTQLQSKAQVFFSFAGMIQAGNLPFSGRTLLQYVPKVGSIVGASKTWNFANVEDITTTIDSIGFLKANWLDAANPPDKMVQIVQNGANKEVGQVLGYNLTRGASKPSTRQATNDAGFVHTTRKMYPKALIGNIYPSSLMPSGTVQNVVAYRAIYNPNVLPSSTVFTWYYDNNDIVVVFDTHVTGAMIKLPLPQIFNGKNVTVVEKHANVTVHSEIVSEGGVLVSTINSYGYATLKLS